METLKNETQHRYYYHIAYHGMGKNGMVEGHFTCSMTYPIEYGSDITIISSYIEDNYDVDNAIVKFIYPLKELKRQENENYHIFSDKRRRR